MMILKEKEFNSPTTKIRPESREMMSKLIAEAQKLSMELKRLDFDSEVIYICAPSDRGDLFLMQVHAVIIRNGLMYMITDTGIGYSFSLRAFYNIKNIEHSEIINNMAIKMPLKIGALSQNKINKWLQYWDAVYAEALSINLKKNGTIQS